MTDTSPSRTQADRADQARARILDAATQEFGANGLAGARTERIAQAAGVNKALIYYYFHGKEALYAAALEAAASRVAISSMAVLEMDCSPGERLLRSALNHFHRICSQSVFQSLMQQEMIRFRRGESNALSPLVEKLFRPMAQKMLAVAKEGIESGELVPVEPTQLIYSTLGPNVFYFLSAPMMRLIAETDVFAPEALELRRRSSIGFLGQAMFIDRAHGARIAERILADTPLPPLQYAAQNPWHALETPTHEIEPQTHETKTPHETRSGTVAKGNIEAAETSANEVRNH